MCSDRERKPGVSICVHKPCAARFKQRVEIPDVSQRHFCEVFLHDLYVDARGPQAICESATMREYNNRIVAAGVQANDRQGKTLFGP